MKYYKLKGLYEDKCNGIVACQFENWVQFFTDGPLYGINKDYVYANIKYAAYSSFEIKKYYINDNYVGDNFKFKSGKEWRKHLKLLAFL